MAKQSRVVLKLNMDEIRATTAASLDEAMFEAGQVVATTARSRGKGSIGASVYVATLGRSTYQSGPENEKERKPGKGEVVVGAASFLAHFHEAGTIHMAARPFFRPAFDATKAQAAARAADVLRRALEAA